MSLLHAPRSDDYGDDGCDGRGLWTIGARGDEGLAGRMLTVSSGSHPRGSLSRW